MNNEILTEVHKMYLPNKKRKALPGQRTYFFLLLIIPLFLGALILSNCGNKNKNGNLPPGPYGFNPYLQGGSFGEGAMGRAVGTNWTLFGAPRFELVLDLFAGSGGYPLMGYGFPSQFGLDLNTYQGIFFATGFINIITPEPVCNLFPGQFPVSTLPAQPGQWLGYKSFRGLALGSQGLPFTFVMNGIVDSNAPLGHRSDMTLKADVIFQGATCYGGLNMFVID